MSLYLKFLAVALTSLNLMAASNDSNDLVTEQVNSASKARTQQTLSEEEQAMERLPKEMRDVFECAQKAGLKPFVKKFRDGVNAVFSDTSIDYVYGLYGSVCNTVPEWALWASAGFFVDSCTLGFFCDSHLGALAISSMLCYGSAKVSQLFGSNKAQDEVRSTLLSYCLDKMLGRNKDK